MTPAAVASLPPAFADLEPFVERWALASTNARERTRQTSSFPDIEAFYDAMRPRLEAVFEHLDSFDVSAMPADAERLLLLSFGYVEAAIAVEIFKAPGIAGVDYPHGFSIRQELYEPASDPRKAPAAILQ